MAGRGMVISRRAWGRNGKQMGRDSGGPSRKGGALPAGQTQHTGVPAGTANSPAMDVGGGGGRYPYEGEQAQQGETFPPQYCDLFLLHRYYCNSIVNICRVKRRDTDAPRAGEGAVRERAGIRGARP